MLNLILAVILVALFGLFVFYPIRTYTAYQLTSTGAWRDWEVWKHKLEEQGFVVDLKEVEQSGTATKFYYTIKKKK